MKKTLKITGIVLGSLVVLILAAGLLVPVLFKDKIFALVKDTANKNLNAVVDFDRLDLSVFRHFPDLTVGVDGFSIAGVDKFEGDTLASVDRVSATVNIMSYLRGNVIDIKAVEIASPRVMARVLADSTANWDIVKPSEEVETPEEEGGAFNMKVKRFVISDGAVIYEDLTSGLVAGLNELNFSLRGDLSDSRSMLDILLSCANINVVTGNTKWLSGASMNLKSQVDADLENMLFTLTGTDLEINRIALAADGTVRMGERDSMVLDLTYQAKVPSLKTLLEMVPASVLPDVKNVDTRGQMALSGWVRGVYGDGSMPQAWVEMNVADGYIKYTALPNSIDNIQIDLKALYDGNDDTRTKIDVSRFHFELAGNPFDATASVATPMTDADIRAVLKGKIDFASLRGALPLEGVDLSGAMVSDIRFAGRMSAIEKEQYDRLDLEGTLVLQKFTATTKDLPLPIDIAEAQLKFSPKYVNLTSFDGKMGRSDLHANGSLENFLNYALKDETLKGRLQLTSTLIDCNELLASSDPAPENAESAPMSVVVLPSNVDLTLNAKIGTLHYDKITLTDAGGVITVKNGVMAFDNLGGKFAGGTINLTGNYRAKDASSAFAGMNMALTSVDVKGVLGSFDMFSKVLPIFNQVGGKISMNFNFTDDLDQNLSPVLSALNAAGSLKAENLQLLDAGDFNKIIALLGVKETSNTLKDINASFTVSDGRVGIKPFDVAIGGTPMKIGGDYGLDGTIASQIDFKVPASAATNAVNSLLGQIGGGKVSATTVNVGVAIGGTAKNPTFSLAKPKYMTDSPSIADETKAQVQQVIDDKTKELQEKAAEEVNKQAEKAVGKLIEGLFKKK